MNEPQPTSPPPPPAPASSTAIGIPILIALWILNTVFVIIASVKTSEGKFYRYPFTIRFLN